MQLEAGENLYITKMNKGSEEEGDDVGELEGGGAKLQGLKEVGAEREEPVGPGATLQIPGEDGELEDTTGTLRVSWYTEGTRGSTQRGTRWRT